MRSRTPPIAKSTKGRFQKSMPGKLMDFPLKRVDGVPLVH